MKSLMLIDISGIFWSAFHATADRELNAAYEITVGKVHQLRGTCDYTAVCADSPPYFRKELASSYKAQRDQPPPQAVEQLRRVKERLVADGLVLWEHRGFEADDVIATATLLATRRDDEPLAVTIASNDKDLLQLVDDTRRIDVLSPASGKTLKTADVIEKFGVDPSMIPDFLAMTGDKSDNVTGIDGVGPVKAAKLLLEFGTLEGVLTHADDIPTPKLAEAVRDGANNARLARKLVALRYDVPINFAEIFEHREPKALREESMDDIDENSEDLSDGIPDDVLPPVKVDNVAPSAGSVQAEASRLGLGDLAARAAETAQSQAIVPRATEAIQRGPFELGLEPTSIGAAWKLAVGLGNSRIYTKFPNAEAICAIIIRGREMGIGALTALDCFHLVEGKPAIHAHLIAQRAKEHPDCEYFRLVSCDDEHAEYETKNRKNPDVTRMRYTLEQAKQAGLCPERPRPRNPTPGEKDRRSNWEKRPQEMLRKSAAVHLARVEYPSAALGLYAIEELEE